MGGRKNGSELDDVIIGIILCLLLIFVCGQIFLKGTSCNIETDYLLTQYGVGMAMQGWW
jgi:hypothetical protein